MVYKTRPVQDRGDSRTTPPLGNQPADYSIWFILPWANMRTMKGNSRRKRWSGAVMEALNSYKEAELLNFHYRYHKSNSLLLFFIHDKLW
jgi:hypothetical protein